VAGREGDTRRWQSCCSRMGPSWNPKTMRVERRCCRRTSMRREALRHGAAGGSVWGPRPDRAPAAGERGRCQRAGRILWQSAAGRLQLEAGRERGGLGTGTRRWSSGCSSRGPSWSPETMMVGRRCRGRQRRGTRQQPHCCLRRAPSWSPKTANWFWVSQPWATRAGTSNEVSLKVFHTVIKGRYELGSMKIFIWQAARRTNTRNG
jgi:hypothetical protein